jgi:transposase InsO family protein
VRCYNGNPLQILGVTSVQITYNEQCEYFDVYVIEENRPPILGCNVLSMFNMIQIAPILLGGKEIKADIILRSKFNDNILPKFKPRSLPFSIKTKVEQDIKDKVKSGILVPESAPIMACPIVPVVKPDGSVRVCGDYSVTANKFIDAEQYSLPTLEDITSAMVNCKFFSKLDLKNAYLQIPLTIESQKVTTISTTVGFYNFTKLPFGISAAPRIFQQYIDNIIQLPNVRAYQDDILIGGFSKEDHDKKLQSVLSILRSHNLIVNDDKSEICKIQVHFLGFLLSANGLSPDPQRVVHLNNIISPSSAKQLKSVLGTLQFYSRFTPNFSSMAAPLFSLLSPKATFIWLSEHEIALRQLIKEIKMTLFLVHYDLKKPLYLTTDASSVGLGAVLSHDPKRLEIIHCASRILAQSEKNYSNIEREALAVIFGIKRFHQYLAGRPFIIQSDHAPLRFIFDNTKPINERISARLQRWGLILKAYDFTIVNIRGDEMFLPDCLSRMSRNSVDEEDEITVSFTLNEHEVPLFKDIQYHSKTSEISKIMKFVQHKWPVHVPRHLLVYARDKMEYSVHNGCLYRGFRIVVPPLLRSKVLEVFHQHHPGMARMRQLMRQFVWWPGLDGDIQKHVSSCTTCLSSQPSRTNCHLSPWPESSRFFQRLFIDICFFDNKQFLVIIDHFSNFVDVHQLPSLTSQQVILALSKTFKYFGLPEEIVCDHGRQFVSTSFTNFLRSRNIELCLTPPYHSPSNGKVERAIRSLKLFLHKNISQSPDIHHLISQFCMVTNFYPNSNGLTPCREYLSVKPRILVKKVLISDKRGVTEALSPDPQLGSSVVPLAENKVAHAGGVIELPSRHRSPNPRYYNGDFVVNNLLSLAEGGVM